MNTIKETDVAFSLNLPLQYAYYNNLIVVQCMVCREFGHVMASPVSLESKISRELKNGYRTNPAFRDIEPVIVHRVSAHCHYPAHVSCFEAFIAKHSEENKPEYDMIYAANMWSSAKADTNLLLMDFIEEIAVSQAELVMNIVMSMVVLEGKKFDFNLCPDDEVKSIEFALRFLHNIMERQACDACGHGQGDTRCHKDCGKKTALVKTLESVLSEVQRVLNRRNLKSIYF